MKRGLLLLSSILLFIGGITQPQVNASSYEIPPPDEALVKTFLERTYFTEMIFEGSNQNWDGSYTVLKTILKTPPTYQDVFCPKVKAFFSPKFTPGGNEPKKYLFKINTTKGCLAIEKWLLPREYFSAEANGPFPEAQERILAEISEGSKNESFSLSNIVPSNTISPEQALRTTLTVYYKTYGFYPTIKYTFEIKFINYVDWLVTIDDHDGIGGLAYLTINAFTGEPGEIKEEE